TNEIAQEFRAVYLLFELIEESPIQNSGVLLFRCDDDGVGFCDAGEVVAAGRNDIVGDPSLEDFPEFLTLLGIRPQNEDGVRHSVFADPQKLGCETIRGERHSSKRKNQTISGKEISATD